MAWVVDRSGPGVCEVSGTLRARVLLTDARLITNQIASNSTLSYALKLGATTVLSGTASVTEENNLQTAITITTALDVSKTYEEEWTGTIVSADGDTTTTIRYRRAVRPQTFPIRYAPITALSLSALAPILPAPASFGSWRVTIDLAWETVITRALRSNAGDILSPGVFDDAASFLALSRIYGYLAGYGSQTARERSDHYLTLYSVEMDRLAPTMDRDGDGVADVSKSPDGLGVGAL